MYSIAYYEVFLFASIFLDIPNLWNGTERFQNFKCLFYGIFRKLAMSIFFVPFLTLSNTNE